jgi:hypothetical protein
MISVTLASCNSNIDGKKVNVDDTTKIYTYKENGNLVTGTVVLYELDPKTTKEYKFSVRKIREGKRINKGYDYYPNGAVYAEYEYDNNGLITGTVNYYFENGKLGKTSEFKENKQNGLTKEFDRNGNQVKEITFEADKKVKEYDFENGKKIIPAIEQLQLVEYKTGYYQEELFLPMVIMKWKNISDKPLEEIVIIEGIFINNKKGEELSKSLDYFQGYSSAPLQVGLSRQSTLRSSVGFTSPRGVFEGDISCQILINEKLYKTVKIKNAYLYSNRIQ